MQRKRPIQGPDGQTYEAVEINFRAGGEHWNEYLLDDSSVVRIKLVVKAVHRVEGQFDGKGQPIYIVESDNVMSVSSPTPMEDR